MDQPNTVSISPYLIARLHLLSTKKTNEWSIVSISTGTILGKVSFHPPWRRYVFSPNENTLYDTNCLIDIAAFCLAQTTAWKKSLKEIKDGR